MQRNKFVSDPGKETPEGRLHKYREACRVFAEIQKNQEVLRYMMELFGEIEDKLTQIVGGLPPYELVYGRMGDSAQAFDHNGVQMKVSFKLRDTNSTLVYEASLKIADVFELTDEDLRNRILGSLQPINGGLHG